MAIGKNVEKNKSTYRMNKNWTEQEYRNINKSVLCSSEDFHFVAHQKR